jgi:peptidyl-prolyl cis-trans isomerase A (cyclophilin A)
MGLSGLVLAAVLATQAAEPTLPRAMITTAYGPITLELDHRRAPVTACNFMRYASGGLYDGGRFFRSVLGPINVVQAETVHGSDDPGLGPIRLERTIDTGLLHVAGAVSMARDAPDTATSSFFIVTHDSPALDFGGGRNPDGQGFGVFARVVGGMELLHHFQGLPATEEQIRPPVTMLSVVMLDPVPMACFEIGALS